MGLYNISIALIYFIGLISLVLVVKFYNRKLIITLLILIFSFTYAKFISNKYDKAFLVKENIYIARIESNTEKVKHYNKYTARIKSGLYKNLKILIYTKKNLSYGQILEFSEKIEKPDTIRNDKGFDYSRFLREKKICGIVKIKDCNIIKKEINFFSLLFQFKLKLIKILDNNYSTDKAGFLKAILLGEASDLDENIKSNFKNANISHIIAISGMHISYIVLALEYIQRLFIKNIKLRNAIIIIFLIIFTIFVGASNSVSRACIMVSITYLGKILLEKDDFYTSFKVALCVLLILNPYNIFSGSMWLSFGGSLGIVLYSKLIEKIILKKLNICKKKLCIIINTTKKISNISESNFQKNISNSVQNYIIYSNNFRILHIGNTILRKIVSIISVTCGAQIIVFPIMIYIFNTISLNFIISNLLISELIAPILIIGYISLIFPFVSIIESFLIKIIFLIAEFSASLPFSNFLIPTPNLYKIIIYYIILGFMFYIYNTKKFSFYRLIKKYKLKVLLITFILLITIFGNFNFLLRKNFTIHFLDVGQGDSCLITTRFNKKILIDGGKGSKDEYDYGERVVGPYLLDNGIKRIDYLIVSHFDSDHCGGLFYILENFDVKNIIIGKQAEKYSNLVEFIKLQQKRRVNLISVEAKDVIEFDRETKIKVLFPDINNEISKNKINNNSLVFKMQYNNTSILFTGDIEKEAESVLVNLYKEELKSDILKVGHHGSKTSSCEEFLKYVSPQIALIGVGKNNIFGHPNEEVIGRLEEFRN